MSAIFGPSLRAAGPLLASALSAEHIVPFTNAAAGPVQLAEQPTQRQQLWAHLSGREEVGELWLLKADRTQLPTDLGCVLWKEWGTLTLLPPPLVVPEAQESGCGCTQEGLGKASWLAGLGWAS